MCLGAGSAISSRRRDLICGSVAGKSSGVESTVPFCIEGLQRPYRIC